MRALEHKYLHNCLKQRCSSKIVNTKSLNQLPNMSKTMHLEISKIQKGVNLLGLKISPSELNELQSGNIISLEGRGLSEIGAVFILAEALSAVNSVKSITFGDLPKVATTSRGSGIPIYCWNSDITRFCIVLTLVDGNPAIKVTSSDLAISY